VPSSPAIRLAPRGQRALRSSFKPARSKSPPLDSLFRQSSFDIFTVTLGGLSYPLTPPLTLLPPAFCAIGHRLCPQPTRAASVSIPELWMIGRWSRVGAHCIENGA